MPGFVQGIQSGGPGWTPPAAASTPVDRRRLDQAPGAGRVLFVIPAGPSESRDPEAAG